MLSNFLEQAVKMTRGTSGPSYGGMGAIHLHFDHYECRWQAFADWSDGSKISGEYYDDPLNAMMSLCDALREFLATRAVGSK